MGLNVQQKKAVEYLSGPLLVLAGPGTGKTQLLSEKVAYILKQTDANPENILCLTFTESGASNMRERLKTIIGKDALKVNIGTYHAFGSEILAQYKNYSEDYDRRLDAAIDEVAQYKIVKRIQEGLPRTDILRGDNVKDIISVIGEAKAAGLSAEDLAKVAEQNMADSEVLSSAISPLLENVVPRNFAVSYEAAYQPIYEILKEYENVQPIMGRVERSIAGLARDLKTAIVEAEGTQSVKPLSGWKDAYFEKDYAGNYRLKDRVANKKLASIARMMGEYQRYLLANGLFDFNDMIEEAVGVLKRDAGFRATLQERYQFVMLDEFQDTNPSQFEIVKQLTDYENPQIMAVGDDDQAIYEFQGALASNLTDFQEYYGAEVIPLTENYRSTQEILDFSREVILQAPDRFGDKILTAHRPDPKESQIYRYEFLGSDAEYKFVADKIAELIASGVPQNEIAVISYKTKYFEPLLPYLKAHEEIKIAYEKRDNLFEDEKIHQILTVMRYVYEMANEKRVDTSVLEILSYPCFGLPILEVLRLVEKAKRDKKSVFDEISACGIAEITEVAEFLAEMTAKSFTEPLWGLVDRMVEKIDAGITDDYERFRFYENLAALRGKVGRHFGEKALRLGDLIEFVDDYTAAEMTLSVTSPYKDADAAVQVLTAHKAKGLEFRYVFMIAADDTAWGKGKGNNNMLALPKNMMFIRHTGTTDGEKLRILYVTLTRAKEFLYITNSVTDFNGKSPKRLEYFGEYVEKDADGNERVVAPMIPSRTVECCYDVGTVEARLENLRGWLANYVVESPDMRAIYRERVAGWRMSASALTSFIDVVYAGPQEFFKSYILQAPREPETEALAYGDLVHKVFEQVTNKGLTDEQAVEYYLAELARKDLPAEVLDGMREKGVTDLAMALVAFGGILRRGLAEMDFGSDKLVINGVPVTGKIDHIVVDDAAKTIEVYDFKTGAFHKEKWGSHATLYKYMLQLLFYKMLLGASPRYSKYRVERAHILFVTPDKDGQVYDKVYEYDEADEAELLALMKAVYEKISSLEFLDEPEVFVEKDERKGIKDIREFVGRLVGE